MIEKKQKRQKLAQLEAEKERIQQKMREKKKANEMERQRLVEEVRKAEEEANQKARIAKVKAEEEKKLRQGNPFLRGLKKVGLGLAGVVVSILGVATSPIWLPPLAIKALVDSD